MKLMIVMMCLYASAHAFPKFDKKTLEDLKVKACPMINGKKDCTVEEVKVKALDLKKKIKF
jgi:hypothetical protein